MAWICLTYSWNCTIMKQKKIHSPSLLWFLVKSYFENIIRYKPSGIYFSKYTSLKKWRTILHVQFTFLEKLLLTSAGNFPALSWVSVVLKPVFLPRTQGTSSSSPLEQFPKYHDLFEQSVLWQIGVNDNFPDDSGTHLKLKRDWCPRSRIAGWLPCAQRWLWTLSTPSCVKDAASINSILKFINFRRQVRQILLITPTNATCFGHYLPSSGIKYMIFKPQNKMRVYLICGISQIVRDWVLSVMYLIMIFKTEDGQ